MQAFFLVCGDGLTVCLSCVVVGVGKMAAYGCTGALALLHPSPVLLFILRHGLCFPGWPETHFVAYGGLEFAHLLPQPPW